MTAKDKKKLLFTTIEDAINFGLNRSYGEFDFTELYNAFIGESKKIQSSDNKAKKTREK